MICSFSEQKYHGNGHWESSVPGFEASQGPAPPFVLPVNGSYLWSIEHVVDFKCRSSHWVRVNGAWRRQVPGVEIPSNAPPLVLLVNRIYLLSVEHISRGTSAVRSKAIIPGSNHFSC